MHYVNAALNLRKKTVVLLLDVCFMKMFHPHLVYNYEKLSFMRLIKLERT